MSALGRIETIGLKILTSAFTHIVFLLSSHTPTPAGWLFGWTLFFFRSVFEILWFMSSLA